MLPHPTLPSPLQRIADPVFEKAEVEVRLKRDDLIHPLVPGNKWRKLIPNLRAAAAAGHTQLLTFGGAYSNHIRAVAAAAHAEGLSSIGVIRGDELADRPRNWSLAAAETSGMRLAFWDRAAYRQAAEDPDDPLLLRTLEQQWGRCYVIPEGGTNVPAARGCAQVPAEIPDLEAGDLVCCAVGTGGTLAGIAAGLPPGAAALGVAVLRGTGYLESAVGRLHMRGWGHEFGNWQIDHGHHFGGYGRVPDQLQRFAAGFEERHGVPVERRYVAKMLHAVYDLAHGGRLRRGSRVTAVLTGPQDPGALTPGPDLIRGRR